MDAISQNVDESRHPLRINNRPIAIDKVSSPIFQYKRHANLAKVKDVAQLHRFIESEVNRLGFSDYHFTVLAMGPDRDGATRQQENYLAGPLSTMPPELQETYHREGYYRCDMLLDYIATGNTTPIYQSTIRHALENSLFCTETTSRNEDILRLHKHYGFHEYYVMPIGDDGTVFSVTSKNEDISVVEEKVEQCKKELHALGRVIRHVCASNFPTIFSSKASNPTNVTINRRPLAVLAALANGCPTVYAVAAELGITVNTTNHHIAAAKKALGAASTFHAIAIALRQGLIPMDQR